MVLINENNKCQINCKDCVKFTCEKCGLLLISYDKNINEKNCPHCKNTMNKLMEDI